MGNRSITYFTDGKYFSPGIYTQWNGGRIGFYLKNAMLRSGSVEGSAARFIAECCKQMPGNLSVYLYGDPSLKIQKALLNLDSQKNLNTLYEDGPGDNGTYRVMCEQDGSFTIHQISKYFEGRKTRKHFNTLEAPTPEYTDKVECRFVTTLPARKDSDGIHARKLPKQEVKSTLIKSIAVSSKGNLIINFHSNDSYRYYGISDFVISCLIEAVSKGEYFNDHIKGRYPSKKIKGTK
ncbi:MAG: hypothetical protein QG670_2868 [Thermoproteota archaeon]|nr:hypothetical protein [Thermoproteota archaeon]